MGVEGVWGASVGSGDGERVCGERVWGASMYGMSVEVEGEEWGGLGCDGGGNIGCGEWVRVWDGGGGVVVVYPGNRKRCG